MNRLIAAVAMVAAVMVASGAQAAEKKTVLVFSLTKGFRHKDAIEQGDPILKQIAEGLGYNAVVSDDPAVFDPDKIKQWDLMIFNNTTGNLFKEPERRKALIDHIKLDGAGFIGIHAATDCFYDFPEYGEMLNGWFSGHPWSQQVTVTIEDPDHPLMKPFGGPKWKVRDEIYQFRNYDRSKVRVLMSIDTSSVDVKKGKRRDRDYATCWIRPWGKGRVCYQAHGHGANVFKMPEYQGFLKVVMQWAIGDIEVDTTPSKVEDPAVAAARAVEALRAAKTDAERAAALDLAAIHPSADALPLILPLLQPGSPAAELAADAAQVTVDALADLPKDQKIDVLRKALDCSVVDRNARREIRSQLQRLGVRDLPVSPPAGFVASWWVAGPIPNPNSVFLGSAYPPEAGVDLEHGFIVKREGEPLTFAWKKIASDDDGIVKLRDLVGKEDGLGAYLYTEVSVEKDQPVQLLLGVREHYTAWLNGEKVGETVGSKGLRPGQFKLKGTLKAGVNRILLKVSQNKGDWGACLQIVGPKNEPVAFTAPR